MVEAVQQGSCLNLLSRALYAHLRTTWGDASEADVAGAVETAVGALELLGLHEDAQVVALARRVAERDLLLRLGARPGRAPWQRRLGGDG